MIPIGVASCVVVKLVLCFQLVIIDKKSQMEVIQWMYLKWRLLQARDLRRELCQCGQLIKRLKSLALRKGSSLMSSADVDDSQLKRRFVQVIQITAEGVTREGPGKMMAIKTCNAFLAHFAGFVSQSCGFLDASLPSS